MPNPTSHRRHRRVSLTLALLVAVVLAGCGDAGAAGGGPDELAGDWVLTAGEGPDGEIPLTDESGGPIVATLTVDGPEWSGTLCNHYFTEVEIDGDRVTVGGVGGTEMGCLDQQVTTAEQRYWVALAAVDTFEVAGDELTLTGPDVRLAYAREVPPEDAPLIGTTWRLETLVDGETASSVMLQSDVAGPGDGDAPFSDDAEVPTLRFDEDGTYLAFTGCRGIEGPYELSDGEVTFLGGHDDHLCSEAMDPQDAHHRDLLVTATAQLVIEGPQLTVSVGDRALVYRAETPPTGGEEPT